jgi:hypothetical protein
MHTCVCVCVCVCVQVAPDSNNMNNAMRGMYTNKSNNTNNRYVCVCVCVYLCSYV